MIDRFIINYSNQVHNIYEKYNLTIIHTEEDALIYNNTITYICPIYTCINIYKYYTHKYVFNCNWWLLLTTQHKQNYFFKQK
jgi:hypothetical protein